jgi:DtxR family Mn-dependent transcriptional regulator
MGERRVSPVVEEYLEAIYRLEEQEGVARTGDLVKELGVAFGTVTNTVKRLAEEGLVVHVPYRGVRLTEKGRRAALDVLRYHRLSERLLTDLLDVDWREVHEEACRLEHALSEQVAEAIEARLGYPRSCPHGNPIPNRAGTILEEPLASLAELKPGEEATVARITREESRLLHYLSQLGLVPGAHIRVEEKAPFNGPLVVRVAGSRYAISAQVAEIIRVRKAGK